MDPAFWLERWRQGRTAFHEGKPNALLAACFPRLYLRRGDRVFVPLCGKATDLDWIASQGNRVAGAELSQSAVKAAFERMGLVPRVENLGSHRRYTAENIEIFVGDIFDLSPETLGPVDAIYDRAALVALPGTMRPDYARHLMALTNMAQQLLIAFDYDQSQMEGPPFSVGEEEIREHYGDRYDLERAATVDISGSLSERCSGSEIAWLLTPA